VKLWQLRPGERMISDGRGAAFRLMGLRCREVRESKGSAENGSCSQDRRPRRTLEVGRSREAVADCKRGELLDPAIEECVGTNDERTSSQWCARREWPCRRAARQRDEVAPSHSITSSARASSLSGTVRPSALAVFVFMTSSNFRLAFRLCLERMTEQTNRLRDRCAIVGVGHSRLGRELHRLPQLARELASAKEIRQ
jgi:hypothetical protein